MIIYLPRGWGWIWTPYFGPTLFSHLPSHTYYLCLDIWGTGIEKALCSKMIYEDTHLGCFSPSASSSTFSINRQINLVSSLPCLRGLCGSLGSEMLPGLLKPLRSNRLRGGKAQDSLAVKSCYTSNHLQLQQKAAGLFSAPPWVQKSHFPFHIPPLFWRLLERGRGFLAGSVVKNLPVNAGECRRCMGHGFYPWVGKIPWRRKRESTPMFLLGEFHGQRSLVGYSPWGCKRVRHDWATSLSFFSFFLEALIVGKWGQGFLAASTSPE